MLPRSEHRNRELMFIGNREVSERQREEFWDIYKKRKDDLPKEVRNLINSLATANHGDAVGFRRRNLPALLAKYFIDMRDSMERAKKMIKPGKYAYYVVGNNSTNVNGDKIEVPTNKFLWQIGEMVGWKQIEIINMELLPSRDIFRKNRGSSESILVFKSRD